VPAPWSTRSISQINDDGQQWEDALWSSGDEEEFGGSLMKYDAEQDGTQGGSLNNPRELNDCERGMRPAPCFAMAQQFPRVRGSYWH
jgi:hypothetical protein